MSTFTKNTNFTLVNVVVQKHAKGRVVKAIGDLGARNIIRITARGTLVQEGGWHTKIFPTPSPELEAILVLVPDSELKTFHEKVIEAGKLNISGNGLIYSIPCNDIEYSEKYPVWNPDSNNNSTNQSDLIDEDSSSVVIIGIVERGGADAMSKAAVHSGAHGPVVTFAEGRGLRDKIRLLRMTKTAEKELVQVVVDETDKDLVFSEMAKAGKITEPGRGFLYYMPLTKAQINLPGVVETTKYAASMHQMIAALDELKGTKTWRSRDQMEVDASGEKKELVYLENLVSLTCVVPREQSDMLIDAALAAGAPAASVGFGSIKDEICEREAEIKVNREWGFIYLALAPSKVDEIKQAIQEKANTNDVEEVCFFTLPVPKALTYLG